MVTQREMVLSSVLRPTGLLCLIGSIYLVGVVGLGPNPCWAVETLSDVIGKSQSYTVQAGDTVAKLARHFDIGAVELLAANPAVTSAKLAPGLQLFIPQAHVLPTAPHAGIVINLAELRLFYYAEDGRIDTFPISIGKEGWLTPTGITTIVQKRKNPTWTPPPSIRAEDPKLPEVVPAGPNNPLGQYALSLGWPGYAIHGTNQPSTIGKPSSHGCMRMYPEDIALLFSEVSLGTQVSIVDTPVKFGWQGDQLYMEVTPTQVQARDLVRYHIPAPIDEAAARDALAQAETEGVVIDWPVARAALARHDGLPVQVGLWHQPLK